MAPAQRPSTFRFVLQVFTSTEHENAHSYAHLFLLLFIPSSAKRIFNHSRQYSGKTRGFYFLFRASTAGWWSVCGSLSSGGFIFWRISRPIPLLGAPPCVKNLSEKQESFTLACWIDRTARLFACSRGRPQVGRRFLVCLSYLQHVIRKLRPSSLCVLQQLVRSLDAVVIGSRNVLTRSIWCKVCLCGNAVLWQYVGFGIAVLPRSHAVYVSFEQPVSFISIVSYQSMRAILRFVLQLRQNARTKPAHEFSVICLAVLCS